MKHIAIAGTGPAGAATALLLAQRGMKVTLLEKETAFERVFRGEGFMPAGLDALYQMGLKETFESIAAWQLMFMWAVSDVCEWLSPRRCVASHRLSRYREKSIERKLIPYAGCRAYYQ